MFGHNARKALDELEEYEALSEDDRIWICFCLDMLHTPGRNFNKWQAKFDFTTLASAADVLQSSRAMFLRAATHGTDYRFGAELYPPLIQAGAFGTQYGFCRKYNAFKFLLERILGGQARPWLPSIYLAVSAHPLLNPIEDAQEFEAAIWDRKDGWGKHEPVFVPEWIFV